jgi:hypothetical protein
MEVRSFTTFAELLANVKETVEGRTQEKINAENSDFLKHAPVEVIADIYRDTLAELNKLATSILEKGAKLNLDFDEKTYQFDVKITKII